MHQSMLMPGTAAVCREYLRTLLAYLESFHQRTQPLTPLEKLYARLADFDAQWEAGQVPGWESKGSAAAQAPTPLIDVDAFEGVEELETIGGASRHLTAFLLSVCSAAWHSCSGCSLSA